MTRKDYSPEIKNHPWMTNVVCNRPAGYKTIDELPVDEIPRWIARLGKMGAKLRIAQEKLTSHDAKSIDVVGLEKMHDSMRAMERYTDIVDDCVDQWISHDFPDEDQ